MQASRQDMLDALYKDMCRHDAGNPHRIQHFTKVHAFAAYIGRQEHLTEEQQFLLEAAAVVHDIGIRPADEKYGHHEGPLQEKEGAPLAYEMLRRHGFEERVCQRVSTLVGRHHTYTDVDGIDCRILLEADFLVNLHEHGDTPEAISAAVRNIFRTPSGTALVREMFGI